MGSFLNVGGNGSIYSSRVSLGHVGDWIPVPKCSPTTDSLSMRSGTSYGLDSPCERLWLLLRILLLIRSVSVEGWRSRGHACLFV